MVSKQDKMTTIKKYIIYVDFPVNPFLKVNLLAICLLMSAY